MNTDTYSDILELLHREVKPALGCTEPIAVALCVSRAAAAHPDYPNCLERIGKVTVCVSESILKNAMGVGIPGTGQIGLPIAIALAAVGGDWHNGLEVLKGVDFDWILRARALLDRGAVEVRESQCGKLLYAEAKCEFEDGVRTRAIVEDMHDNITYVSVNDEVLLDVRKEECVCEQKSARFLSLEDIYDFACNAELKDLEIIREQIRLNRALSEEGLRGDYGLRVGKTLMCSAMKEAFGETLNTACMGRTAAASDARMSGCPLPAMSNSGSGNQGITVSMPVVSAAEFMHSSDEALLRAVTLSNLVAIHIKSYLGRLSALCGCVVASTGASCGIVMLKGGGVTQMSYAIKNMVGSITGMICDGAKEGCALKVASGVSCALQSAVLAMKGIYARSTDGIIDDDIEKTIENLGKIGASGMKSANHLVLDIMLCK